MEVTPIDYPINLILIIIGTFLCVSLGTFLFFVKSSKSLANVFLGCLILCMLSAFSTAFLYRFGLLDHFPHVIGLQRYSRFAFGPLTFFFVLASIQKGFEWRWKMLIHFIPFFTFMAFDFNFLFQSGVEKMDYYVNLIRSGELKTAKAVDVFSAIYSVVYYVLAAQQVLQYRQHVNNSTSSIDEGYHRWVLFFIGILAFPFISLMIFAFVDYDRALIALMFSSYMLFVLSVYIAALIKPKLFHRFPHQMPNPDSSSEKRQKYETSNLAEDDKLRYVQKLEAYIRDEKPYLEPELTLAQLADKIGVPAHYLSQVINEKLNQNFLDYINGHRIEEAKRKLLDDQNERYTILSIAFDSGFNSKSTFYSAFKKATGMTPNQYRQSSKTAV